MCIRPPMVVAAGVLLASTGWPQAYELRFSTRLGGQAFDSSRAVAVGSDGSVYVAGGTQSPDFPTTDGALSRQPQTGGATVGSAGPMSVFVTKLSPAGRMVWSTLLGGPNYDRAYSIEVDAQGYVYVGGRAGDAFPTTDGVVQPEFLGDSRPNGPYGQQDGFITKLTPDGSAIVWSTYFGTPGRSIVRDIDIDAEGHVYLTMIEMTTDCPHVTEGAFQTTRPGGQSDSLVAKISPDGAKTMWATYLGGSERDLAPSVRVTPDGQVYVSGSTTSADFPVTSGAFDTTYNGTNDAWVAKLKPDGSGIEWGTYLGGADSDGGAGKHGLALDSAGNAHVAGFTNSRDFPVTPGVFQREHGGGVVGTWEETGDRFVAKVSADGAKLLACTFIGGRARDGGEGIVVDSEGRVMLSGFTYSADFPVGDDAIQRRLNGKSDAVPLVLSADLTTALLSTYMGGATADGFRACAVGPDGDLILVGSTDSTDWPTQDASPMGPVGGGKDVVIVKFTRAQ